ncbi:MAG TPA: glycosyltransferase family 4 protein [Opitutaceae bacterium]
MFPESVFDRISEALPLRISIVTSRRYHLLDLARELAAIGHAVRFFSCMPVKKVVRAGLPLKCFRSVQLSCLPWLAAQRFGSDRIRESLEPRLHRAVDRASARRLGRCDFVIGLSGTCVRCFQKAKSHYGSRLYLERGGRHILSQKDILEQVPGSARPAITHADLKREIWGYTHADVVVVASQHAEQSFLERGVDASRIFRTPYGVDLDKFGPTARLPREIPTVLYVGTWSNRNGCDLLGHALRGRQVKLIHVGPRGDAAPPVLAQFERREMVEDWELCQIFRSVDILVRPSRGEGLDMVLAQALAAGVPVVCTDRSGGEDLREFVDDPEAIIVAKAGNLETLSDAIRQGLALAFTQGGPRCFINKGRDALSWRSYGQRYHEDLIQRMKIKRPVVSPEVTLGFPIVESGA